MNGVVVSRSLPVLCFTLVALVLTGPALVGRGALGPDSLLDWDPLLRTLEPVHSYVVFGDLTPTFLDFPKDMAVARGLGAGRLDQWNPLSGCGMPLWAEQTGPFFPLKLPFYLLPSRQSHNLFLALRLVVAALGVYLLARQRGLATLPAIAAGVSFELSGAMMAQLPFAAASPLCLLPWVILGSYSIAARRTTAAAAAAAIALGIAASGGHPTLILLVFLAFAFAIAGHLAAARRSPRTMLSIAALGALAALLGLALAAPSLLPLADLASLGSSYKERPIGAAVWRRSLSQSRTTLPIALFAPGTTAFLQPYLRSLLAFAPAIGALGLTMAIAGLRRRRIDAALASVAALGIVLSTVPPGFGWIEHVPGVQLILPRYAWPLVLLLLSQAVGSGVQALSAVEGRRAGLIAFAVLLSGALSLLAVARSGFSPFGKDVAAALEGSAGLLRLGLPVLLAGSALSLCFALQRTRHLHLGAAVLLILLVFERMATVVPVIRLPASTVLSSPPSPAVRFLQGRLADGQARMTALPFQVGRPLSTVLFGLADVRSASALPVSRYYEYMRALSPKVGPFTVQDTPVHRSPLLDLAAVRYVVLANPPDRTRRSLEDVADALVFKSRSVPATDDPSMSIVYRDDDARIYENLAALPRVRIVHRTISIRDQTAARQWLERAGAEPAHTRDLDIAHTVVLEPDATGALPPATQGDSSDGESVRIADTSEPDRLLLEARLASPGFVVVADTYDPGWRAWVDGVPTSIFPANFLFRAVAIPAGDHVVEMRYEPSAFRLGVGLFAAASLACAGLFWSGRRRSIGG